MRKRQVVQEVGSDSFSSSLQKRGLYYSLILQGFDLHGNVAKFQTESLPRQSMMKLKPDVDVNV
jgi:hypothetical protein